MFAGRPEATTPYSLPNWQAAAGGSRPGGVDFARIDPPEFFSAPAAPFLAGITAATYGDSIFLGVAVGPRGNPWGPATHSRARFYGGPFGFTGVIDGWNNATGYNRV